MLLDRSFKNPNLSGFIEGDEKFFKDYFFSDDIENNCKGMKVGTVINVKDNLNVIVHIDVFNLSIECPLFFNNKTSFIKEGEKILVYFDDLFNAKALNLHPKTLDYIKSTKNDASIGTLINEVSVDDNKISLYLENRNTKYNFKKDGMSFLSNLVDRLELSLRNKFRFYFSDIEAQGITLDVITSSLNSFSRNSFMGPSGISFRSFTGNIEIYSSLGSVDISSLLSTNVSSIMSSHLVSGIMAGISAPAIPNVTVGFGAPLIPSPTGINGMKNMFKLMVNPFRIPLPTPLDDGIKRIKSIIQKR